MLPTSDDLLACIDRLRADLARVTGGRDVWMTQAEQLRTALKNAYECLQSSGDYISFRGRIKALIK